MTNITNNNLRVIIAAGGTGGHIFPALAVAIRLIELKCQVSWVGTVNGMENQIVAKHNIHMDSVNIVGLRKKSWQQLVKLPWMLCGAIYQSIKIVKREQPHVVLSFGGYVSFPLSIAAKLSGVALVIHEQNSVAGLTNKILAKLANRVLVAYRNVLPSAKTIVVGNPVRRDFFMLQDVQSRYNSRQGGLRVLVIGGSLGAAIFNRELPAIFAKLPHIAQIIHQVGNGNLDEVASAYHELKLNAQVVKFIDNVAKLYSEVDLIICRSGALTVTEVCASGVAALFVPYPHAVDDHQRHNVTELVNAEAALMILQQDFTVEHVTKCLRNITRAKCLAMALKVQQFAHQDSCDKIVDNILIYDTMPSI